MKFSVVLVNYHSWPYTLRCIDSLYGTGYEDFEVVVVVNDQTTAPEIPYPVRLIRNPENVGFARACNQGVIASDGEYVALINNDTLLEGDFFESLQSFFDENPRVGVAGTRVVDAEGNLQLTARKELSFVSGLLGRTSLLTRLLGPKNPLVRRLFPAAEELIEPTIVDWVSGTCMIIRRRTLEEIGLLDERFFMYFEDADLCRRAWEGGWLVYYLPQVEVLHHSGVSTRKARYIWYFHKSAFLYHRKYGPHGPLGLYSLLVLLGLSWRGIVKLAALLIEKHR